MIRLTQKLVEEFLSLLHGSEIRFCEKGGLHDIQPFADDCFRLGSIHPCSKCPRLFLGVGADMMGMDIGFEDITDECLKVRPLEGASNGHCWTGGPDGHCHWCGKSVI
ncbi:hypothetical protein LCGC14_0592760 [marine sediment metagenome]|uniref:Uncharacterized protein n=1 Tax=marine sediment metagenome TaxID=412755 RepID=A0A0F9ULD0_9ZZZZ